MLNKETNVISKLGYFSRQTDLCRTLFFAPASYQVYFSKSEYVAS